MPYGICHDCWTGEHERCDGSCACALCWPVTATRPVAEVRVRDTDAVIVNLPAGTVLRVLRDGQDWTDLSRDPDDPVIAVLYGSAFAGASVCWYGSLRGVRNDHHERDREIWHQAVRAVSGGGVVHVECERQDSCGRPAWPWQAVGVRTEEAGR